MWLSTLIAILACVALLVIIGVLALFLIPLALLSLSSPPKTNHEQLFGSVSHTRTKPTLHSFTYPIWFTFLKLNPDAVDDASLLAEETFAEAHAGSPFRSLLSSLVRFEPEKHLVNERKSSPGANLVSIVCELVRSRAPGLTPLPTPELISTGKMSVVLLTTPVVFGYGFNPVSFYYFLQDKKIVCIVGEVANTPWQEQYCYVLCEGSSDVREVARSETGVTYVFQKRFHVSPFNDNAHTYRWRFSNIEDDSPYMTVSTAMIPHGTTEPIFSANFKLTTMIQLTSRSLLHTLTLYPFYTAFVQIRIHWQALRLFAKGVEFVPHPEAAETAVSRAIACIMTPVFWIKERLAKKRD